MVGRRSTHAQKQYVVRPNSTPVSVLPVTGVICCLNADVRRDRCTRFLLLPEIVSFHGRPSTRLLGSTGKASAAVASTTQLIESCHFLNLLQRLLVDSVFAYPVSR